MNVADVIAADRVAVATAVHSKKRALQQLAALLAEGAPYLTAGEVFSALIAREKLGCTGTGYGVAIPHARMPGLDDSIGALLQLPSAVDFGADDGQPVDLVFGLIVPATSGHEHAALLHTLTTLLGTPGCRVALRQADSAKALLATLVAQAALTPTGAD